MNDKGKKELLERIRRATPAPVIREPDARLGSFDFTEVTKALQPVRVLHFNDDLQDFLKWYVAANGVVVCSEPFQTSVWAGTVVIRALVGKRPIIRTRDGNTRTLKHTVEHIEELSHE